MDGAQISMIGRAANNPTVSNNGSGDRVSFRMISTERRMDAATGQWVDGHRFSISVVCWRSVADGVRALVRKGDPVLVHGRISEREFQREGGQRDWWREITADFVGFDVARAGDRIRRGNPREAFGTEVTGDDPALSIPGSNPDAIGSSLVADESSIDDRVRELATSAAF